MKRMFVQARKFSIILDDLIAKNKVLAEDFEEFEKRLLEHPDDGDVIQGAGGLRKTRLKSTTKGKSGSFRICY